MGPVFVKKGTHPNNQGSRIVSCLNENNIIEPISSFVFQGSFIKNTQPTMISSSRIHFAVIYPHKPRKQAFQPKVSVYQETRMYKSK